MEKFNNQVVYVLRDLTTKQLARVQKELIKVDGSEWGYKENKLKTSDSLEFISHIGWVLLDYEELRDSIKTIINARTLFNE